MTSVLILTHGRLAAEILRAARKIAGELETFEALCLDWDDSLEVARDKVAASLTRLDRGHGVLILTDVYGGTPSNAASGFYRAGEVEIISGVNLPMVVRLGCILRHRSPPLAELARVTLEKGRASLRRVRGKSRATRVRGCTRDEDDDDRA